MAAVSDDMMQCEVGRLMEESRLSSDLRAAMSQLAVYVRNLGATQIQRAVGMMLLVYN